MEVVRVEDVGQGFDAGDEDYAAGIWGGGEDGEEEVGKEVVAEDVGGEDGAQVCHFRGVRVGICGCEARGSAESAEESLRGGYRANGANFIGWVCDGTYEADCETPETEGPVDASDPTETCIADDRIEMRDRIEKLGGQCMDRA